MLDYSINVHIFIEDNVQVREHILLDKYDLGIRNIGLRYQLPGCKLIRPSYITYRDYPIRSHDLVFISENEVTNNKVITFAGNIANKIVPIDTIILTNGCGSFTVKCKIFPTIKLMFHERIVIKQNCLTIKIEKK